MPKISCSQESESTDICQFRHSTVIILLYAGLESLCDRNTGSLLSEVSVATAVSVAESSVATSVAKSGVSNAGVSTAVAKTRVSVSVVGIGLSLSLGLGLSLSL